MIKLFQIRDLVLKGSQSQLNCETGKSRVLVRIAHPIHNRLQERTVGAVIAVVGLELQILPLVQSLCQSVPIERIVFQRVKLFHIKKQARLQQSESYRERLR